MVTGPKSVQITREKVAVVREHLHVAQNRQKSRANDHRRPLTFSLGDKMYLRVSPMKGVMQFGQSGKLSSRFVGLFEILEKVGDLAYRLALPPALSRFHNVFLVSQLKQYILDPSHVWRLNLYSYKKILLMINILFELWIDQVLRRRVIPYVKGSNHTLKEATWELEEKMKNSYPQLFSTPDES